MECGNTLSAQIPYHCLRNGLNRRAHTPHGIIPHMVIRDDWSADEPQPKGSIIIISHNRPKYLREALFSLLNQTDPSWEAIVMETSTGGKRAEIDAVLKEFTDKRIRVFGLRCDNICHLWHRGIEFAHGRYLTTLDDDNRKRFTFVSHMAGGSGYA